ncbi:MAG: sel1 repeat family protein [Rhodospirillales bacterium]|nr:sel1 repeat family protein [Rhodospirillales bacterium]
MARASRLALAAAALLLAVAQAPAPPAPTPPPARMPSLEPPPPAPPADFLQGKAAFEKGDYNGAYLLLLPWAHRGNPEAQYLVGRMSDEGGTGIALDPVEAARWYRMAAAKEYPKALYAMAKAAAVGRGMRASPEQALDFLVRAANADFTPAILDLAALYDDGRGVEQDRAKAFDWYDKAAKLGNTEARFVMGERLHNGDGVEQDRPTARQWYELAAGRGHPGAMFRLAQLGVARASNLNIEYRVDAYAWATLAQQRGGPSVRKEATELRNQLGTTMIQVDIDKAMARVRAWKPQPPLKGEPVDPDDPYNRPAK